MEQNTKIKNIILFLISKNGKVNKILLHKFVYFLSYISFYNEYDFEPHTYGPYSFDLASNLKLMQQSDDLLINKDEISFNEKKIFDTDAPFQDELSRYYDNFLDMAQSTDFANLEIMGTLMYCIRSLRYHKMDDSFDSVLQEFKGWKHQKYDGKIELIKSIYDKVYTLN